MTEHLFGPLQMESCGFGPPGDGSGADAPVGHAPGGDPFNADNPALSGPAGTVHCSMADWGRFLTELLRGARGESEHFEKTTVDRLFAAVDAPVENIEGAGSALGWVRFDGGPNGSVLLHDGSNTFWYSQAIVVPGLDLVVLGVANHEATGAAAVGAALQALSEMYPGSPREASSD